MELLTHKSSSGAQIIALSDPAAFTTSLGWFVNTGARDESVELAGVSHFLEHMVFKGTRRRTAEQVNRELDHLGAQSNACTSEDSTVFYASVLPEYQERAVDLLTDLMQPVLNQADFDTERQVILEEIAMYDDQPPYGAFERAMELFFAGHPLSRRVLGTTETVSELTVERMREYHRQRYTLDNMFLVASGQVDFERLVEQADALTQGWPTKTASRTLAAPKFKARKDVIARDATHQQYIIKIWPGVSTNDPTRYAVRMMCNIIADESGSRLFWELIDTGRAETASLFPQLFDDCGCLVGYLCCAPEDAAENDDIMMRVIGEVAKTGITQKEIDLARNKIVASLILSDERPSNRLFAVGEAWLSRRHYEPLEVILKRFSAVSVEDIQQAAQQTLSKNPTTVQVISDQ